MQNKFLTEEKNSCLFLKMLQLPRRVRRQSRQICNNVIYEHKIQENLRKFALTKFVKKKGEYMLRRTKISILFTLLNFLCFRYFYFGVDRTSHHVRKYRNKTTNAQWYLNTLCPFNLLCI